MNKIKKTFQLRLISRQVAGEISGHKYKNHKTGWQALNFKALKQTKTGIEATANDAVSDRMAKPGGHHAQNNPCTNSSTVILAKYRLMSNADKAWRMDSSWCGISASISSISLGSACEK